MALTEKQTEAVLSMFVNSFASAESDSRKKLYLDLVDSFMGSIKQWETTIYEAFIEAKISSDIISEWQSLEADRKDNHKEEVCEILKMTMADEKQIVKLLSKEIGWMPRFAEFNEIGSVKDFEATGYSYVAKKGNDVIGLIMAQRIMDYGSYHIFVNNFAVDAAMQGKGVGRQLMDHLIRKAKSENIHRIMLHTEKKLKAYDIYHHMGFEDQEDESVYLSKWFI